MDRDEAFEFLDFIQRFNPSALLMSGGEPLTHPDFFSYLSRLTYNGTRVSLSTNGVLIDDDTAREIARLGVSYVGVSIDGVGDFNDDFRGMKGAFRKAARGMDALVSRGCRVGLRVTLTRSLIGELYSIFDLALDLPVSRICFYHFIPAGRGALDAALRPSWVEERRAVNDIINWSEDVLNSRGIDAPEILTVGDASDGVLAYKYLLGRDPARAGAARELLLRSTSRRGPGILSVRWDGAVYKNQFSWDAPLGSWRDLETICAREKGEKRRSCNGRDTCRWSDICRGSLRLDCMAGGGWD
jgi:MoaA/NifB/PqqE/SkfB family radical SAM enzyme